MLLILSETVSLKDGRRTNKEEWKREKRGGKEREGRREERPAGAARPRHRVAAAVETRQNSTEGHFYVKTH